MMTEEGWSVSFRTGVVPILQTTCGAFRGGCHDRSAYFATVNQNCRGWLALEDAALGANFRQADGGMQATCDFTDGAGYVGCRIDGAFGHAGMRGGLRDLRAQLRDLRANHVTEADTFGYPRERSF